MYPDLDFWFENKPSGNLGLQSAEKSEKTD
jgi:hypothetical protein